MSPRARALAPVLVLVALAVGCSGDDGSPGASGSSSTGSSTTSAPLPGPPDDPAVVGTWTADGSATLEAALAGQGLDEEPTCTGEITLELGDDGAFTRTASGTCDFGESDGEVEIVAAGGFTTADGEIVLEHLSGSGTIRGSDGEELALPDETATDGGSVAYEVTDDTLTLALPPDTPLTFARS